MGDKVKRIIKLFVLVAVLITLSFTAFAAPKTLKTAPKTKKSLKKLVLGTATSESLSSRATITFKDVKESDSAYPYILKMVSDYGVISGYPDGTFKGKKTITRAEFCKIMTASLLYLEKKYGFSMADEPSSKVLSFKDLPQNNWAYAYVSDLVLKYNIFTGYPDGTFKPNKTISKYEMASVVGKALKVVLDRCEIVLKTTSKAGFSDVKSKHWAKQYLDILLSYDILSKGKVFGGASLANRYDVAIIGSKLIDTSIAQADALGESKLAALRNKYAAIKIVPKVTHGLQVYRQLTIGKPHASVTGLFGNINESASSTNNWMNFGATASYGNTFKVGPFKGDYEFSGKYGYNQIVYLIQSGGGTTASLVNESRIDLDLNTIHPVVDFYGFKGLLLTGLKYVSLSNSVSPISFPAINVGIVTVAPAFGYKVLGRAFYSLIPSVPKANSALGSPSTLINYELGIDCELLKTPMVLGYSGETMFINGGAYTRFYNMFFVRYFIL